jgi:hypothetical protein
LPIALDQQATLIDLDGTAPLTAPLSECVRHFVALKASAKVEHRILLTRPVPRKDRPTRTWILNPDDIEALAAEAQG